MLSTRLSTTMSPSEQQEQQPPTTQPAEPVPPVEVLYCEGCHLARYVGSLTHTPLQFARILQSTVNLDRDSRSVKNGCVAHIQICMINIILRVSPSSSCAIYMRIQRRDSFSCWICRGAPVEARYTEHRSSGQARRGDR